MKNIHRINGLIYITSEDDIKLNDWFLNTTKNKPMKSDWLKFHFNDGLKLILTNDLNLIYDGIQAIEPDAVKWLNENPSCEWVDVDNRLKISSFEKGFVTDNPNYNKINLPKSQTIEEAADELTFNQLTGTDRDLAKGIAIKLALSQAARDYWFNIFISEQQC